MIELIYNKWLWIGAGIVVAFIVYRLFSKDKTTQILETEYSEIINSDKYKVKGQYD